MSKGMTKEELRAPDAFISYSDKILKFILDYKHIVISVVLVIFTGSLGYLGWQQYESYQNRKATEAIYKDEKPLRSYLTGLIDSAGKAKTIDEAELKPLVEKWQAALNANKQRRAAVISFMNMTQLLREKGQLEIVKSMTENMNPPLSKKDFLWALWRFQKAGIFVEAGENDKAVASLQEITKEKQADWLHGEALLRLGMIYEKTDKNQAIQTYEKILAEHGQTSAAATAKRLLDQIKQKNS